MSPFNRVSSDFMSLICAFRPAQFNDATLMVLSQSFSHGEGFLLMDMLASLSVSFNAIVGVLIFDTSNFF